MKTKPARSKLKKLMICLATLCFAGVVTLREILARVKDFFYVIITTEPTYLGEAVPVNGNGDVTND